MNPRQQAALKLIKMGVIVQPAVRLGKYPVSRQWQNAEAMSAADAMEVWGGQEPPNISALTGDRSGIFVVDIDGERGRIAMGQLVAVHGDVPATYTVRTPGGIHLYYRHPEGVTIGNSVSKVAPGIDVRGTGGHVIAESSQAVTRDNSVGDYIGNDLPIADPPQWLVDKAVQSTSVTGPGAERELATAIEYSRMPPATRQAAEAYVERALAGERELLQASASWGLEERDAYGRGWEKVQADVARRLISLARGSWNPLSLEEAQRTFIEHAPTDAGWTAQKVAQKWAAELRKATPAPMPTDLGQRGSIFAPREAGQEGGKPTEPEWRRFPWDDVGNADRMKYRYEGTLRYVSDLKKWASYRHGRWEVDELAGESAALELLDSLEQREAPLYADEDQRKKFAKWAKAQRASARVSAAAKLASLLPTMQATTRDFDLDPMLFNVANGTIDLRTGALLPHNPAHMIRQQSSVAYDPTAQAPMWLKFLERVMPDPEMRSYLQRVVGYSLTALTIEQVVFLHHGVTQNGKSVFLKVIEAAMGTYNQTVPPNTLLAKRLEQHPTDVARMEGKRMLQLAETPQGARLDEALVKRMSGGDTVTARGMGENFRDFDIVGKVHVVTNHPPHISTDDATWRRLRTIRWGVQIPDSEADPYLATRIITDELPGVLAWAVRGALDWQQMKLRPPQAARMDTELYRHEEDQLGRFLGAAIQHAPAERTPFQRIWAAYKTWCDFYDTKPMAESTLGKELVKRGYVSTRTGRGMVYHVSVNLDLLGANP